MTAQKSLHFSKMHGLGNDFMVINANDNGCPPNISQWLAEHPELCRTWADRHCGIGFDQCIIVERGPHETHENKSRKQVDFHYRIFNADGGEVEQCGNGARCVAEFIAIKQLSKNINASQWVLTTPFDRIEAKRERAGQITLTFPPPKAIKLGQSVTIHEQRVAFDAINLANPHAVVLVDDIETAPVSAVGDAMTEHRIFPEGANIEFVQRLSPTHIAVRVRERGVGETLACGTGAMAAMVACFENDYCQSGTCVSLPGGDLQISWAGKSTPIYMTGPAVLVYDGIINLEI